MRVRDKIVEHPATAGGGVWGFKFGVLGVGLWEKLASADTVLRGEPVKRRALRELTVKSRQKLTTKR